MTGPQGTFTAAGPSQYVFFLSYARADGEDHLRKFFDDLREMVGRLMGPTAGEVVGFMDTSDIEPGQRWPARLEEALSTCRAFVPVLSPTYFTREACGKEWAFFRYRLESAEGQIPPLIIPVLWVPLRKSYEEQPFEVSDIQVTQRDLGDVYAREGLYYLLDVADRKEYREFLRRFADKLIDVVEKHPLPAIDSPPPFKELESAFRDRSLPGRREEDLLSRIETVCRLREPKAQIEKVHGSASDQLGMAWRIPEPLQAYVSSSYWFYRQPPIAWSPDGGLLASADGSVVRLWDVGMGRELRRLEGHTGSVLSVNFSPAGDRLASGSSDGTVRLWDVGTGRELRRLEGHESSVWSVSFSPNGNYLASGSDDNTIRLWEVATGRCLAILGHLPEGWVAFSPDGRYKIGGVPAGGFWHVIGLCRFEPGELDPYVPGLRLPNDASFLDLPPWDRTGTANPAPERGGST